MSGEVTVSIPDLIKYQQEYDKAKPPLPSQHQIGDAAWLRLWSDDIIVEIHAVHFTAGKVKYDVNVLANNGDKTRLYNVDSVFIHKRIPVKI